MSALAKLFKDARRKRGWKVVDVARRADCGKLNKSIRNLEGIESGDDVFPRKKVLERFAKVLELDETDILGALCQDFEELDRPVPPTVIVRLIPAVYVNLDLPEGCTTEKAIEVAAEYSKRENHQVCVTLSQIRGLYIHPGGQRFESYQLPASTLAGLEALGIPRELDFKKRSRLGKALGGTHIEE